MTRNSRAVCARFLLASLALASSAHAAVEPAWKLSFEKEINVVGTDSRRQSGGEYR